MTRPLGWTAGFCAFGALMGGLAAASGGTDTLDLSLFFLVRQDAAVLALMAALLLLLMMMRRGRRRRATIEPATGWPIALVAAAAVAAIAAVGVPLIHHGYPLSMDEFMAVFDSRIFAEGRLFAPVAPEWRDHVAALQPIFRLAVAGDSPWASMYLPVNAAIRAAFAQLGWAGAANAALAALSVVALYGVARRLWPARPDAALVAVLLLATSSQFLVTAMTPYAMTAHLALNLVWLWLHLRDDRIGHAAAIAVGFAAAGLHQVIFHPIFVAPFVLSLWLQRRWGLAAWYTATYAAIGLFWISYWNIALDAGGAAADSAAAVGIGHFAQRVADLLAEADAAGLVFMTRNLFRFVAWQNPLTLPLLAVGLAGLPRLPFPLRPLAGGILLTLAMMTLLLPFQGHGWGYRYLHGLLGSVCLLAAQGWVRATGAPDCRSFDWPTMAASAAFALLVALPLHAVQVERFVRPYAAASEAIARADADIVIIDPTGIWYGADLVRNDPYLRDTPKVMALNHIAGVQLEALCRDYRVALFARAEAERFGIRTAETPGPTPNRELRALMNGRGCGRAPLR